MTSRRYLMAIFAFSLCAFSLGACEAESVGSATGNQPADTTPADTDAADTDAADATVADTASDDTEQPDDATPTPDVADTAEDVADATDDTAVSKVTWTQVVPAFVANCASCHPKPKESFNASSCESTQAAAAKIKKQLELGTMPPYGSPMPSSADRAVMLDWIATGAVCDL
jgi:hypothetical protein